MQKIDYLDGLRGIAALVVVLAHYAVGFYPASYTGRLEEIRAGYAVDLLISGTPFNIIYGGNFAVMVFFILSGYVLTYKFFIYKDKNIILSGAIRRYFRLLIPVSFSMFIGYLFLKMSLFYNQEAAILTTSTWWLSKAWNFEPNFISMLKQAFFGVFLFKDNYIYNGPTWTMMYEFYGSFLVFGFVYFFGKLKMRYVLYAIAISQLIFTNYLAFILGVVLADLYNGKINYFNKINDKILIMLFLLIGLFLGSYPPGREVNTTIYGFMKVDFIEDPITFYHTIGAFFLMIALLNSNKLKSAFSNGIVVFFGKISFSMYLMHFIVLCSFSSYLFIKLLPYFTYSIAFIITFALSMMLIIFISYYMYIYIDNNGIKFSHFIHTNIVKKILPGKYLT